MSYEIHFQFDVIQVIVRVRPISVQESERKDLSAVSCLDDRQTLELATVPRKNYTFNELLQPGATQAEAYERSGVRPLIQRALGGYACTVFAFGQTGSGKTYTITGPPASSLADEGLIPRAIRELCAEASHMTSGKITLSASYIEIYNEQVLDLLNFNSGRGALPVRWKADRGFYVENLFVVECEDEEDMLAVLEEGMRYRHIASHEMNERSSRSHAILTINIERECNEQDGQGVVTVQRHGSLTFIDLAGSERVKVTKSLLVESNNINKSLLTLGNCISALGDPKKCHGHIPYRESTLTMLLKDSLGGTAMTLMIACISPATSSLSETSNTLRYASRAKRIENKPIIRIDPQQQLILALKREVRALRKEVAYLRAQIHDQSRLASPSSDLGLTAGAVGKDLVSVGSMAQEMVQTKLLLQQYMEENDQMRSENVFLYSQNEFMQRQYEDAIHDNELVSNLKEQEKMGPKNEA